MLTIGFAVVPSVFAKEFSGTTTGTATTASSQFISIPFFGVQFNNQYDYSGGARLGSKVGLPAVRHTASAKQIIIINFKVIDLATGECPVNEPYAAIFRYNGENEAVAPIYGYEYLPFSFYAPHQEYQLSMDVTSLDIGSYIVYIVIRASYGKIYSPTMIGFAITE